MKRTLGWFFSVVIMLAVAIPAFSAQGASSKSNKSQVFSYLTQEIGFNTAAACGVMANMEHESGFDSSKVLYDSNGLLSGGLCMWNGGRFSSLKRFCNNNGYNYLSIYGQLKYLEHELKSDYYDHIYDYLKSVSNDPNGAYNAAYYWCYYFEIPANRGYHANKRGGAASSKYWNEFSSFSAEPETPVLKSASAGKTVDVDSSVRFSWTDGGDGATSYVLLVTRERGGKYDFSCAKAYKTSGRTTDVTVTREGRYAARVYSVNGYTGEKSAKSNVIYFTGKCLKHSNRLVSSKKATFSSAGLNVYSCEKCGEKTQKAVPVLSLTGFSAINPTGFKVAKKTASSVTLKWNRIDGADGYEIYIKAPGGKWGSYAVLKGDVLSFTAKKLSPSTAYKFAVKGFVSKDGKTVYTKYAYLNTKTGKLKVSLTDIERVYSGKVKLEWNRVSGADGYKVYVSKSPKSGFKAVKGLSASKTSYTVSSLKSKTCYYFTVKAYANTPNGRVYSKAAPVKYAYAL